MTSNEKIKRLRESLRLSISEFARRLNYTPSFISQIENNIRNPGLSVLKKISDTFKVPISDLIGEDEKFIITEDDESLIKSLIKTLNKEEMEKVLKAIYMIKKVPLREIPVLGYVVAGEPLEIIDIVSPIDIITYPENEAKNASFALYVKGDSMKDLGIEDGDILLIDANSQVESGSLVIAIIDNKATFKRFKRINGKVLLEPANENYQPIELKENMNIKMYKVTMAIKRKKF
ncbi:MAG: helix-turn-helix domain-containing protein [Caldisericia bacterium]